MRIELECTGWADKATAWEAVLSTLAAPDWHGRNLDALLDGLSRDLLLPDRPLELVIHGEAVPGIQALLLAMREVFEAVRHERGEDVRLTLHLAKGS